MVSHVGIGKTKIRRLHHTARCWRIPGRDYVSFVCYDGQLPLATEYDCLCKQCFGKNADGESIEAIVSNVESDSTEPDSSEYADDNEEEADIDVPIR